MTREPLRLPASTPALLLPPVRCFAFVEGRNDRARRRVDLTIGLDRSLRVKVALGRLAWAGVPLHWLDYCYLIRGREIKA